MATTLTKLTKQVLLSEDLKHETVVLSWIANKKSTTNMTYHALRNKLSEIFGTLNTRQSLDTITQVYNDITPEASIHIPNADNFNMVDKNEVVKEDLNKAGNNSMLKALILYRYLLREKRDGINATSFHPCYPKHMHTLYMQTATDTAKLLDMAFTVQDIDNQRQQYVVTLMLEKE